MKRILIALGIFLLISAIVGYVYTEYQKAQILKDINSFADCKAAGLPIMESFPEQCITPDGRNFTNTIASPQAIELSGEMVCLPHREQSGPQTMECAFGLKTAEGIYYALRDSDPDYKNVSAAGTGATVVITGKLMQQEDDKYQSSGIILIDTLTPQ
jgi:hypothetical protein